MASINKDTLEYLAGLARIDINEKDEEKLLKDLQKILDYFDELKEVDSKNVEPMSGGNIFLSNVFRKDSESSKHKVASSKLKESFPEQEDGFLKIPPVFE